MFVAMNRFRVKAGGEAAFEEIWKSRDRRLESVPGFVEFHLLRGETGAEYTLFASQSIWASRAAFEAWTRSEQFRAAHRNAGATGDLLIGSPVLETFDGVEGA